MEIIERWRKKRRQKLFSEVVQEARKIAKPRLVSVREISVEELSEDLPQDAFEAIKYIAGDESIEVRFYKL